MNDTKIEWVDKTINPVVEGKKDFERPEFFPKRLEQIRKLANARRPYSVFLNSMSDIADWKQDWLIDTMDAVDFANSGKYTHDFIVLTKRPADVLSFPDEVQTGKINYRNYLPMGSAVQTFEENLYVGITATCQKELDERVPHLLQIPAKGHFVSLEPLCGPVDFESVFPCGDCGNEYGDGCRNGGTCIDPFWKWEEVFKANIDCVIVGGMTGKLAEPMDPRWVLDIRNECLKAGVKFYFKQWGSAAPDDMIISHTDSSAIGESGYDHDKRNGGRNLDGRTHDDLPWVNGGVR